MRNTLVQYPFSLAGHPEVLRRITREWARDRHGWGGRTNGDIYSPHGVKLGHGWKAIYARHRTEILDRFTWSLTAFRTFEEMVSAPGTYRPTILYRRFHPRDWRYKLLADLYDAEQVARGNPKRAFRGSSVRYPYDIQHAESLVQRARAALSA